jgi:plastocyanin
MLALGIKVIGLTAIAAVLFLTSLAIASAQQLPSIPAVIENGTFQSTEDGFRVHVPEGWVVQDIQNTGLMTTVESNKGYVFLAIICPQEEALPGIGGLNSCEQAGRSVTIWRYLDLGSRPEFAVITNPANISINDLSAFIIRNLQEDDFSNIRITNTTDLTINMTSAEDPNTTVRTVPAEFVEMTYQGRFAFEDTRNYNILALVAEAPETGQEQTLTGIRMSYEDPAATTLSGNPPASVQQIFDSFVLLEPSSSSPSSQTLSSPPQQEEQQQQPLLQQQPQSPQRQQQQLQQQNQGASVSIVSGSSSLTDTAFQPNPVQINVGDTVTWTNDDTQPHTVTAGAIAQPSGEFDSSPNFNPLISPQQTFSHTFTQAGQYPYYCALHPNMVGTVNVS